MSPRTIVSKRRLSEVNNTVPTKLQKKRNIHVVLDEPLQLSKQTAGAVFVFGDGVAGQLGLGEDNTEKGRPAAVPGLTDIIDIAAGGMHSVCLTKDQNVITFGCNDEGALGRDTSEEGSEFVPLKVEIPSSNEAKVVQISAGDSHTAVLLDDGTVYFWGTFRDSHGPMGLRFKQKIENIPVLILTDIKMTKIASGSHHLVMLGKDHQIYSCGCAEQGQLGRVSQRSSSRECRKGLDTFLVPTIIKFNQRKKLEFVDIWTGSFCTFAKEKINGEIYVFGLNNYKQIGLDESIVAFRPLNSKCFGGNNWVKISGGEHHTAAMNEKGSVFTLGRKEYGRLGLGPDCEDAEKPILVPELSDKKCVDITCGSFVTFAAMDDGSLYSWGMGSYQLGLGGEDNVYSPTLVKSKQLEGKKVTKVSSGGQHTIILTNAS